MQKAICLFLVSAVLLSGCASSTLFQTEPSNATIYASGFKMGSTPYIYTDRKISGAKTAIVFKKEGYKEYETTLKRNERGDVWAFLGGLFFMAPFLWIMKYDPIHSYVLEKADKEVPGISSSESSNYLRWEGEKIKITIDSIVRSASLPYERKEEIESMMNMGQGYNIVTKTYQPYFKLPELYKDNDYILIYITVNEKKDLNLNEPRDAKFQISYLKNKFGELYGNLLYRGPFCMAYGGQYSMYNSNLTANVEKELKNELFVYTMPKNLEPILMQLTYYYREDAQLKTGKIEINLIKDY